MYIFDGIKLATDRETLLKERIARDFAGKLKIVAILFSEDVGSQIYTRLKSEAAARVGIKYEVHEFSLSDNPNLAGKLENEKIIAEIQKLNTDESVTGIIIQKPWRKTWAKYAGVGANDRAQYNAWWSSLTSEISEEKDVDGLHPNTIQQIKAGTWKENGKVLPATCRAVLTILDRAGERENFSDANVDREKTIIIGKSDLLGIPLYFELLSRSENSQESKQKIELIASQELKERMQSGQKLLDASIVISATGIKNLITGDMVSAGVTVIDVGEPRPDVDFVSVSLKASFITPVPGGVGPMTVVSLLENCVDLAG